MNTTMFFNILFWVAFIFGASNAGVIPTIRSIVHGTISKDGKQKSSSSIQNSKVVETMKTTSPVITKFSGGFLQIRKINNTFLDHMDSTTEISKLTDFVSRNNSSKLSFESSSSTNESENAFPLEPSENSELKDTMNLNFSARSTIFQKNSLTDVSTPTSSQNHKLDLKVNELKSLKPRKTLNSSGVVYLEDWNKAKLNASQVVYFDENENFKDPVKLNSSHVIYADNQSLGNKLSNGINRNSSEVVYADDHDSSLHKINASHVEYANDHDSSLHKINASHVVYADDHESSLHKINASRVEYANDHESSLHKINASHVEYANDHESSLHKINASHVVYADDHESSLHKINASHVVYVDGKFNLSNQINISETEHVDKPDFNLLNKMKWNSSQVVYTDEHIPSSHLIAVKLNASEVVYSNTEKHDINVNNGLNESVSSSTSSSKLMPTVSQQVKFSNNTSELITKNDTSSNGFQTFEVLEEFINDTLAQPNEINILDNVSISKTENAYIASINNTSGNLSNEFTEFFTSAPMAVPHIGLPLGDIMTPNSNNEIIFLPQEPITPPKEALVTGTKVSSTVPSRVTSSKVNSTQSKNVSKQPSVGNITKAKLQCPSPGICIFWFMNEDTCAQDSHCFGSRICCTIRCSKTCIEIS